MTENFYKSIINQSPNGYAYQKIICNDQNIPYDYEFLEVNPAFEAFIGFRGIDIIGKRITEVFPKITDYKIDWIKIHGDIAINGGTKEIEDYIPYLNGWYRIKVYSPKKNYTITISTEITKEFTRRNNEALKKSEEKYRLLTENASDVIWVVNITKGKVTYISPSIFHLRGFTVEESMGEKLEETLTYESLVVMGDSVRKDVEEFLSDPQNPKTYIHEIQQPCKNGDLIWVEVSTRYRFNDDNEVEVLGVSRNIDQRKKTEKQMIYLSYNDQLTGLYNRRFYEQELKKVDTVRNLPITLIMADVNGLKLTNDAFGHLVGDELLKKFSEILKKEFNSDDIIARIGGDEFVILLPQTDSIQAEEIVKRIKSNIAAEKTDKSILSVSLGWATKIDINEEFEKIYMKAEEYMYRRKLLESLSMKNDTIKLITKRLYDKNSLAQQHCERVSKLCCSIGLELGLSVAQVEELRVLGLLYDIGKIGINEDILNNTRKYNGIEYSQIKRHPEIGYQILKSVNQFSNIAEYVLAHHEMVNGRGYPRNLKGDEIPLQSRILSIAKDYDRMIYGYLGPTKLSEDEAIQELIRNSGSEFDTDICKVFVEKVLHKSWV
ncbi:MAG: diguanylate cyclase [Clostridium sp.]